MLHIDNDLILIKGEDKTASVERWDFEPHKPVVFVTYRNGKSYPYNKADFLLLKKSDEFFVGNKLVLKNNLPIYRVEKLQYFNHYFTTYCRICYKSGYTELIKYPDIRIVDSALNLPKFKKCFEYLYQIALQAGLTVDGHNILASHYQKINFIREDSILAAFLTGNYPNDCDYRDMPIIYPFGFNLTQKKAVENALAAPISVIEGPPGTGKTQTILNIIANAVLRGESVAVVSSNNSATENIWNKLKKYGVSFIAAPLGNISNKESFVESQMSYLPDMARWQENSERLSVLRKSEEDLNQKLNLQIELSSAQAVLDGLEKEYAHFSDYYRNLDIHDELPCFSKHTSAEKILAYMAEYEQLIAQVSEFGFWKKLFWRIKYGLRKSKFINRPDIVLTAHFQNEFYQRRLREIKKRTLDLQKELCEFDFDEKMKSYSAVSMQIFKGGLAKKYGLAKQRKYYTAEDLKRSSDEFIKDYPVVLSTTYSLKSSLSSDFVYDYVIVDEASQVDLASGALALSCAKKAVIVGDLKQLPNVVNQELKIATDRIFNQYMLPEAYRYSNHSLLSSTVQLFPTIPHVLLKEHYRCHPEIIGFCNRRFYNNELIVLTKNMSNRQPLVVYKTVPGNHARNHMNQRQIDVITNEVFPMQGLNPDDGSVGIVTPYRNQANELKKVFENTTVKVDTVDKFQGQEKSVMIFSTVDNEIGEFASDPNRLNVAISRAIDQLIVVTDGNDNDTASPVHELIGYINYHNHDVIDSEIHSVFDYLYRNYAEARAEAMRKYGRVSDVESENLMYRIICDVLRSEEYEKYDVVLHVPLRMILSDLQKLNTRELSFATNYLTHVDFLIFSKFTHQPVLVVEVDGFAYHHNEKQQERDQVKDAILQKYNIPILRLSTIGSGEKEKLISVLKVLNVR